MLLLITVEFLNLLLFASTAQSVRFKYRNLNPKMHVLLLTCIILDIQSLIIIQH